MLILLFPLEGWDVAEGAVQSRCVLYQLIHLKIARRASARKRTRTTLHYAHRQPDDEPGLWLPDGVAWAAGAGRSWLKHLDGAAVCIERIDP